MCAVHRTIATGESHPAERAIFRRKDGTPLYAECTSQPIIEDGEARGAAVTVVDSGNRGRAEEVRSRYAAILEATTNFIGMADIDGRVLVVNRAGREMVGVGENEEVEGTSIAGYHPRWAAEIVRGKGIPTALREGSWSGESALLTREGKEVPVWQVISSHRGPDGNVQFLSTTIRDITERKRAERESAQNRRLFEGIAEATPDLLYVAELADGSNVYANGQVGRILGYDQEQLAAFGGTINEKLVHPVDKARVLANWAGLASLGDGEVQEHEFRARHADGRYRWLRARNVVLSRTPDGHPWRVLGVAQDVTERKRADQERERLLEESERRAAELDAVIRGIPDAVYVGDETGIRVCNDAALKMLGFEDIAELNRAIPLLSDRLQNRFAATGQRIPVEQEPFVRALRGETVVEEVISRHLQTGRDVIVRCAAAPVELEGRIVGAVAVNTDVTEQKEAEERLAYHAHLLDNTHDAVIATDERFIVSAWNKGAEEVYGWRSDEALGRPIGEVIEPGLSEEQMSEALRELAEEGRSRNELITRRKDGTPVYIEGITAALRGEQGRITGYLSINRDVGERRRAEEALEESHRRIENILESFSDAFFAVDNEWRFTYINERALGRMQRADGEDSGHTPSRREDLLGKNLWEAFPGLVGTEFDHKYREARCEHQTAAFEAYYPPSGNWYEVHAYPSEEGLSVYLQDVTERKTVDDALKKSEQRFRVFFETAAVGAVQVDPATGRFVEVNEKFCRFLGYERDELLSMGYPDVTHPEDLERDRRGMDRLLRGEIREYRAEKRYVRKDGRFVWGRLAVSVVRDANDHPLQSFAIVEDRTERKRIEEALLEIRGRERRRIARDLHDVALQDLAAALQVVQATEIRSTGPQRDLREAADILRRTARSLRGVVHDLRLEEGQPFVQAVEALVVGLGRELAPACEVSLDVQSGFPQELPREVGVELLRIVQEALANARRHSGARRISVDLSSGEGWAGVDVSDDGHGFDCAVVGGSSFGLWGMEERARLLGAKLAVSSAIEEGTRVRVRVPARI
jgi:PAS domain S-box-containing protein